MLSVEKMKIYINIIIDWWFIFDDLLILLYRLMHEAYLGFKWSYAIDKLIQEIISTVYDLILFIRKYNKSITVNMQAY